MEELMLSSWKEQGNKSCLRWSLASLCLGAPRRALGLALLPPAAPVVSVSIGRGGGKAGGWELRVACQGG